MIDGIIASMAFVCLLVALLLILAYVFRPQNNCRYLIIVNDEMSKDEIFNIIYGLHFKSIFYGDSVYDKIFLLDLLNDNEKKKYLCDLSKELHIIKILSVDDLKS